jgi:Flp pilus assembly protein TadG
MERLHSTGSSERGETLIEFALSLTIFLMTLLGTMEFGIAVFRYNMLSNLAQEGARRASVCGKKTGMTTTDCNITTFVQGRSLGISPTVTVTPSDLTTLNPGDVVQVRVQHLFRPFTRIIPLGNLALSSTAQMIVSR